MIWKEAYDRESDIAQLEQLYDGASGADKARIKKQIANIRAGRAGERDAAHFLKREFGESQRMGIVHDLRLELDGEVAQIDHLVIHRFQATAWVLETKNYAGRLTCDEYGDWTVWSRGKPRDIPSPVNQARRQCELLCQWLQANGITSIQKIQPVVLISPKSSIDRSKLPTDAHVVKSDNFGEWWQKEADSIGVAGALRMVGKHLLSGMSEQDFDALGQRLAAAHQPAEYDWRAMLGLAEKQEEAKQAAAPTDDKQVMSNIPSNLAGDGPWTFQTSTGEIKVSRIPDGRFAIRNDANADLIEAVKTSCKGRGQWMSRYRNWLVAETEIGTVLGDILAKASPEQVAEKPGKT